MSVEVKPGDHVVHAVHGPGKVIAVETREMPDGEVEYVSIDIEGQMRIMVPTAELASVGVREPISRADAESILEMLGDDPLKDPGHSGRRRRNQKRLLGGDAEALAKVVRSLMALKEDRDKGLAMRDKNHLTSATDKLVGELAISLGISEDESREMVEEAVRERLDAMAENENEDEDEDEG